jgi:alkanesulfonate monooxygenase SsuD/methylene tetrahydromethanopterin reductase-like flavin-dependent oxidoreductase (luciferase family)
MEIGVGLPATIPGASGSLVLEWARRADSGPFSSLGVIDRLVYKNHEALVSLAAAAVTERVRLMTTVLIAPVRDAALLAKQAATIDAFSGGRLTLGLGVGAREDDFRAASATFEDRGDRPAARAAGRAGALDRRLRARPAEAGRPVGGRLH